jgi:RNA polymerase sigma-70 factor, ECF subfamily
VSGLACQRNLTKEHAVNGSPDDATLVTRCLTGDREAYGVLIERYYRAAYSSAYAVLGHAGDTEEIVQETFVQAWQKLDRLRDASALGGWIWRIARDTALKHIRKHRRVRPVEFVPEQESRDAPDAPLIGAESREHVLKALEELPDDMRDALQMKFWEGLDYDAMALRTGATPAALYQRVCRGLKRLRDILPEADEP